MSRSSHRPSRRPATLVAGAVLAVSALAGATTAEATTDVTDLEATVLRVGGPAVAASTPIPSGRTLTPVRLTTADPSTSAADGFSLSAAVPAVRISRGFTAPARPAEAVTFRIDGTVVATSVPDLRGALLQTDAGPLTAVVFTAGGVTYAIPRADASAVTRTVATSTVGTNISSIVTHELGLLPVGAQPRVGSVFVQPTLNFFPSGPGAIGTRTVLDADVVRGNADADAEELVARGAPAVTYGGREYGEAVEVLATVTLRSGALVSLNALSYPVSGPYGLGSTTWMFDRAALAAAGAAIADVTGVISQAPTDHALTWQDLGFDLV